jgi:hypothetical protein
MTTNTESAIFAGVEPGRCHAGAKTDNPCLRPATETRWLDSPEPTLCAECARHIRLAEQADEVLFAIDQMSEWVREASQDERRDFAGLERRLREVYDSLLTEYAELSAKVLAAQRMADGATPSDVPFEDAVKASRALMVSDALSNARYVVEGAPEESLGLASLDKWATLGSLLLVGEEVSDEFHRARAEVLGPKA